MDRPFVVSCSQKGFLVAVRLQVISAIKQLIKNLICCRRFARMVVFVALKLHNFSYAIAGRFSQFLEPGWLHPKHRIIQYHEWFKKQVRSEWDVLDIGCGNGALAYDLKKVCKHVTAIDISKDNIEKAKERFATDGITYICGDATTYTFDDAFDAIVLSNVLEHITDRTKFLKRLPMCGPKGNAIILLRVPMIDRDWITLYKKERGVEWRLDRSHTIEYTLDTLTEELEAAGLVLYDYKVQFGELYAVVKKK